jgi:hypothetical protein
MNDDEMFIELYRINKEIRQWAKRAIINMTLEKCKTTIQRDNKKKYESEEAE